MELKPVLEAVRGRASLNKVVGNTGWLFLDKVVRLVVGVTVGVWLARYLGPEQFGLYSYVFAWVALASPIGSLGMDALLVKELVARPDIQGQTLGTAFGMRLLAGVGVLLVLTVATIVLRPEDPALSLLMLFAGLTLLLQAFDVVDCWFQSRIESRYVVSAKSAGFFVGVGLKIFFILGQVGIAWIVLTNAVEFAVAAAAMLLVYRAVGNSVATWNFDLKRAVSLVQQAWPLLLSALAIIGYMKIDIVMLGALADDRAVGIYSAATRISEAWYFIPTSLMVSLFPLIVAWRQADKALYHRRLQQIYSLMVWSSTIVAMIVTISADHLMLLLFGPAYADSAAVLAIHIWASIAVFLGVATSQYLIAENLTRIVLYRTVIGLAINAFLNAVLIPSYGPVGAALATLVSYSVVAFGLVFFPQTRNHILMLLRSLDWRILLTIVSDLFRVPGLRPVERSHEGHHSRR